MGSDVNTVYICQRWSGLKCMKDVRADSRAKPPHTGLLHLSSNQCHNWLRQTPVGTQMAASFNRPFKLYQAFFSNHTQFMQSHIKSFSFLNWDNFFFIKGSHASCLHVIQHYVAFGLISTLTFRRAPTVPVDSCAGDKSAFQWCNQFLQFGGKCQEIKAWSVNTEFSCPLVGRGGLFSQHKNNWTCRQHYSQLAKSLFSLCMVIT